MTGIEENGHDDVGDVESSAGGVTGLVASEYERLAMLQDELHEPENWCPEKAKELHGLLVRRTAEIEGILKEILIAQPPKNDLRAHLEYDLGLVRMQKTTLTVALKHGHQHPETERARQTARAHVDRWMSGRGR